MASRAKWRATPGLKEHFIDLCVQEVNQDGRLDRSLKPQSWHRISEGIDNAFEDCKFTQKQLKNEWDYLKRQFLIWYKLTNAAGYDYNEESQTINWTEEKWKAYIKRAPDAKQFRSKPLQCAEQLQLLFESTLVSPHTSDTSDDLLDIDIVGSSHEIVNWEDNGNSTPTKPISAPGTTSRAKWKSTPGLKELFIELCLQEVNQDGRHGKSLKSHSWRRIGKEIAETFEHCKFSQRQLKNEWDYLQRQYQVWYKLTNSPGHGYDEASQTFNWPEEKWKAFIKRFPEAKQFRKKPLQCVDQLKILFECTLDRTGIPVDSPDVDIGSSYTSVNVDDNANYAPGKPIADAVAAEMTGQRSEKRRKKNEDDDDEDDDDDDDAIEEVRGILKLIKSFKAQIDEGPTIAECLKALNQLRVEVKLEPEVYGAALRSFCKGKEYRSLFMMLGCNEDKVIFLQGLV